MAHDKGAKLYGPQNYRYSIVYDAGIRKFRPSFFDTSIECDVSNDDIARVMRLTTEFLHVLKRLRKTK